MFNISANISQHISTLLPWKTLQYLIKFHYRLYLKWAFTETQCVTVSVHERKQKDQKNGLQYVTP